MSPQPRHGKRACAVDQRCSLGLGSARSALGMPKRPGAACTPLWSARSQEFVHLTPPHTWVYHIYNNTSAGSSTALSCETRKKVSTVPLSLCHARTVAHEGACCSCRRRPHGRSYCHSQQQLPSQPATTTIGQQRRCGKRMGVLVGPAGGGGQTRTRVCLPPLDESQGGQGIDRQSLPKECARSFAASWLGTATPHLPPVSDAVGHQSRGRI